MEIIINTIIVILCLLCDELKCSRIIFPDSHNENIDCLTIDGKQGKCVIFDFCNGWKLRRDFRHNRKSLCGFEEDVPKICCPLKHNISDNNSNNNNGVIVKQSKLPEFCGNKSSEPFTFFVVNGKTSRPGSWPWIAALFIEGLGHQCGATLITDQYVITAAHCVTDDKKLLNSSKIRIRLGEHNISGITEDDAEEDFLISRVTVHPKFSERTLKNDIAIMKLERKVRFNSRIYPICLPFEKNISRSAESVGQNGFIAGWGRISYKGNSSDVLQEAQIAIVSQEECIQSYSNTPIRITEEYLCAGTEDSSIDSCGGDSGGPFMQKDLNNNLFYLTGIISFGIRCATPGYPGVYTKVSKYLDWINNNL